jgi:hypothetical protein
MKKIFVVFLALCGVGFVLKGIFGFFPLNFRTISENNFSYDLGHNFGYLTAKVAKIIVGIFLIKYTYDWFSDENKMQENN